MDQKLASLKGTVKNLRGSEEKVTPEESVKSTEFIPAFFQKEGWCKFRWCKGCSYSYSYCPLVAQYESYCAKGQYEGSQWDFLRANPRLKNKGQPEAAKPSGPSRQGFAAEGLPKETPKGALILPLSPEGPEGLS